MNVTRRSLLIGTAAVGFAAGFPRAQAQSLASVRKVIPSSGETVPAVGLGTWTTFNVGNDPVLLDESAAVMAAFFAAGGRMIDSSPMYGSSQTTIGFGLKKHGVPENLFSAEKIWISDPREGPAQIAQSKAYWGVPTFDLMQIHNLVSWQKHLETLRQMKSDGQLRYIGITTSHGRRHAELEKIMTTEPLDFVQLTYNPVDREAEARLLPLAREKGIAIIVNRPFQRGSLLRRVSGQSLPDYAAEISARTWAQLILKYVISHPAVTCAIPATTRVDHVKENMSTASGSWPDAELRARIEQTIAAL